MLKAFIHRYSRMIIYKTQCNDEMNLDLVLNDDLTDWLFKLMKKVKQDVPDTDMMKHVRLIISIQKNIHINEHKIIAINVV